MNLPRMITALSAAHAVFEDKENWQRGEKYIEFDAGRGLEIIESVASMEFPEGAFVIIGMAVAQAMENKCCDHRVFEFAHTVYHLLEVMDETDMARPKTQ